MARRLRDLDILKVQFIINTRLDSNWTAAGNSHAPEPLDLGSLRSLIGLLPNFFTDYFLAKLLLSGLVVIS